MTIPNVITSAGLQPQSPDAIRAALLALVGAAAPGYTVLPGVLIEDISSTAVASIALCDQARVEFFNSITPYTSNPFILNQLGVQFGILPGAATNTSVYVVFTGTVDFVISPQFTVSDGTYQYVVQSGGVVGSDGSSQPLFAIATVAGTWPVTANSVTQILTSLPVGVTLAVTNPQVGTPGAPAQSEQSYRAQVLQAGLSAAQSMPLFMKTQLANVVNVQSRLVSVVQTTGGWEVICGGGDEYAVGLAILNGIGASLPLLVGSTLAIIGVTQANPGVVTTNLNHGYTTGQVIEIIDVVGMTELNGNSYTITVITQTTFSIATNTTGYSAYVSGGVVTPNLRNVTVDLYDYPDTYSIIFVNPPEQTVAIAITWNTLSPFLVSGTAITQAVQPAIATYVNSIAVGQPMNLFELQATFQAATANLVPTALLTRMVFVVSINGVTVSPESGTGIINGDPESYFFIQQSAVTVTQG